MPKDRVTVIPSVYLILQRDNQILLSLRSNTGYADGYYSLPAGHIEPNETLMQALVREAQEEIAVQVDPKSLELVHVLHRPFTNDAPRIDFFFLTNTWLGEPQNIEPQKCAKIAWISLEEIDQLPVVAYVKKVFEQISKKILYSSSDLG